MTYYPDLTAYAYIGDQNLPNAVNIGWLDRQHHFRKEEPSSEFLEILSEYCSVYINPTRGLHECSICSSNRPSLKSKSNVPGFANILPAEYETAIFRDRLIKIGTAEIRVFSEDGVIFASPNLIYHYIRFHHYDRPEIFKEAVFRGVRPTTERYFDLLSLNRIEWGKPMFI